MDMEILLLRFHNLTTAHEALNTRVQVLEYFIRERFPEYFAGEVGTIADPELKPIEIDLKAQPQEVWNDEKKIWERTDIQHCAP